MVTEILKTIIVTVIVSFVLTFLISLIDTYFPEKKEDKLGPAGPRIEESVPMGVNFIKDTMEMVETMKNENTKPSDGFIKPKDLNTPIPN
jgi:hypothetical protein